MKILITGAAGQLGFELARSMMALGDVVALDREGCDLVSVASMTAALGRHAPDVIINAAAYTDVDGAEREEALATRINGEAPGVLAQLARESGALLVHYSTDYVFDGSKAAAWREDDVPAPLNAYGRSKLLGEQAVAAKGGDHLVLRTAWVFSARRGNFVRKMLALGAERTHLPVVTDQIGTPTWARNIADATALIVIQAQAERARGAFRSGIFHLASRGEASRCDFARAIFDTARAYAPELPLRVETVKPVLTADFPLTAPRPLNSRLDVSALERRFGVSMPRWQDALARCMEDIGARRWRADEGR